MTEEEFSRNLKEQNLSFEDLRVEAKKDLAIKALVDKYAEKIRISDRDVEEYYNDHMDEFVNRRGVALAMIAVDPENNGDQAIKNDARTESEAKTKIDALFLQLKGGKDFATVARENSEDSGSLLNGGDIGFATEEDLRDNGFPENLISQFLGPMTVGTFTAPVRFSSRSFPKGRWYIFKVTDKVLRTEKLDLESPGIRVQITSSLIKQDKDLLESALTIVATNEARIINYLATRKIANP